MWLKAKRNSAMTDAAARPGRACHGKLASVHQRAPRFGKAADRRRSRDASPPHRKSVALVRRGASASPSLTVAGWPKKAGIEAAEPTQPLGSAKNGADKGKRNGSRQGGGDHGKYHAGGNQQTVPSDQSPNSFMRHGASVNPAPQSRQSLGLFGLQGYLCLMKSLIGDGPNSVPVSSTATQTADLSVSLAFECL